MKLSNVKFYMDDKHTTMMLHDNSGDGSGGELEAWPQEWYSMAQAYLNYCNLPCLIQVYVVKKLKDRFSQKIEAKSRNFDSDLW